MNILFLIIIPPDIRNQPNLYTELMEEFLEQGHQVFVAAIDEKKNGRQTRLDEDCGIKILHVRTGNLFQVGPIEKGLTTLTLGRLFKRALADHFRDVKFDLVLMPTPPITFADAMEFIKRRDGAKAYLILRDIFPQNAKDIHLLNNGLIFHYFRMKEKKMYQIADHIGCMSKGNINYVIKHNPEVPVEKLELLPNWCKIEEPDETVSEDAPKGKVDYKEKYGLAGKFVCIFGGNIGWPQELEFLMELAESVKDIEDIVFLIVGKGILKPKIEGIVASEKLTNVMLMDHLPRQDYDGLVSQCNVGLINLDRRFTIPNIPSKTTGYFMAGLPILASIDANTDYGQILERSQGGLWSVTGDLSSYRNNLLYLYQNPDAARQMGQNGRKYLEENLTVEKAYRIIMKHVL